MIWWIAGVILVAVLIHWIITKPFLYWKKRNVPDFVSHGPYIDTLLMLTNSMSFIDAFADAYKAMPQRKFYGICLLRSPALLVRDPELIKQVTVKDFDHFTDHVDTFLNEDIDDLWGKSLFVLKGKRWHKMRSTLSPAFTGSKMRGMFELMAQCGDQISKYYAEEYQRQGNNKPLEIEFKEMCSRFTNDIIATTAFGIKCDSFQNPKNEFFMTGRQIIKFSTLRFLLIGTFTKLAKLLDIKIMPHSMYTFFRSIIKETLAAREKLNIVRNDIIQLLIESRKQLVQEKISERLVLTDSDITAQAFLFFVAGFETVAVAMSFASYELTVHPDVQEILYQEIKETLAESNGKFTYEAVNKMKYLDMVVSETLRKWPPVVGFDRLCTKPITLKADNEEVLIERGDAINVSIWGLHRDELYFSEPEKFDPDRFSDENKDNIKPLTYMPFGNGPGICIGSRFALMEVKILLVSMLSQFRFEVIKKTPIPMVLKKKASFFDAKNGFWIGLTPRDEIK